MKFIEMKKEPESNSIDAPTDWYSKAGRPLKEDHHHK